MSLRRSNRSARKMNCMQVGRTLQSYLDDEIDDLTARRIAAHLEDCRRCGMEESAYRELKASLARRAEPVDAEPVDAEPLDRLRAFSRRLADGEVPPDLDTEQPGA